MSPKGIVRFRIEREIANTLQGRVYAGTDLLTNKKVVIKEAWRQLVHRGISRKGNPVAEDFLKERKLIMELTSLNERECDGSNGIVKCIAECEDEHCYYYVMEYCEAELFHYISCIHTTPVPESESKTKEQIPMNEPNQFVKNVSKMFKQICLTVQWLHSKGLCHLDLSLENTMISDLNNLTVKLIDFGLTQKFNNNNFRFKGAVGKLEYMCPEAYTGQVYCLGVMLLFMLTGSQLYKVPRPQDVAFNYIINGMLENVLKHYKRLRLITTDALDLLNNMLRYQNQRITLDKVLEHPFFTNLEEEEKGNNNNNNENINNNNSLFNDENIIDDWVREVNLDGAPILSEQINTDISIDAVNTLNAI